MSGYTHEFRWDSTGPSSVIVTGTFDNWSSSLHLQQAESGTFAAQTTLPYSSKVFFKYIVDGQWLYNPNEPHEDDGSGNINNVLNIPAAEETKVEEPTAAAASPASTETEKGTGTEAKAETVTETVVAALAGAATAAAVTAQSAISTAQSTVTGAFSSSTEAASTDKSAPVESVPIPAETPADPAPTPAVASEATTIPEVPSSEQVTEAVEAAKIETTSDVAAPTSDESGLAPPVDYYPPVTTEAAAVPETTPATTLPVVANGTSAPEAPATPVKSTGTPAASPPTSPRTRAQRSDSGVQTDKQGSYAALGKAVAPSTPAKEAPATPAKTVASTNSTPSKGYSTAPSTPSTPVAKDRSRKSSLFQKIKVALSPHHPKEASK